MAKKQHDKVLRIERLGKAKLSEKESLKRLQEFSKRKQQLVATVRKRKDPGARRPV
jgi:hypothetical protein